MGVAPVVAHRPTDCAANPSRLGQMVAKLELTHGDPERMPGEIDDATQGREIDCGTLTIVRFPLKCTVDKGAKAGPAAGAAAPVERPDEALGAPSLRRSQGVAD